MSVRWFLLIFVVLCGFDQPKLVKKKVAPGISVSVPATWRPMDELDFTDRYPSVRAPIAAFSDEERLVDFSINISATRWPDTNHVLALQFFKASISNMFDRVEMIDEGIRDIHGKKFIFFEFESRVNGNRAGEGLRDPVIKYTYQQYLLGPERTLVFSFNCPTRDREAWQRVARVMMNSVRVK